MLVHQGLRNEDVGNVLVNPQKVISKQIQDYARSGVELFQVKLLGNACFGEVDSQIPCKSGSLLSHSGRTVRLTLTAKPVSRSLDVAALLRAPTVGP